MSTLESLLATGENVGPPSAMLCQPEGGAMYLKWNLSSFPPQMVFLGLCGPGFSLTPSFLGFPYSSVGKSSACNAGDLDLIPGLGRSPGEGNGNPLQYSCLENRMNRGAWQATAHRVARVRHNLATKPPPPPPPPPPPSFLDFHNGELSLDRC